MAEQRSLSELLPTVAAYTLGLSFEDVIQGEQPMGPYGLLATDQEDTDIAVIAAVEGQETTAGDARP